VSYSAAATSNVTSVTPKNGNVTGGYNISITGTNLDRTKAVVTIDGYPCSVYTNDTTVNTIICMVAKRLVRPAVSTFEVKIGANDAIILASFKYVMKWSDPSTWGADLAPIAGDLVYIPAGMNLLVDISPPKLLGIIAEDASIEFADETDLVIQAGFITINRGKFTAGTPTNPYVNKLTFILTGDYYGKQQPMFGNKGIGCMECQFSMYGQIRSKTWTMLASTINVNALTLTVVDTVDWKVGERIAVASTSFEHT
jgi:hypothetical protein